MAGTIIGFLFVLLPGSSPSPLERGDQEFARINYARAEAIYDSALATLADSADVLWRLARVYVCLADVSPRDRRLDLYRRAEAFARRSILADSTKSEGHTWRAAALGNIAMFEGDRARVSLCRVIQQELERSIRLNPADDIAYSILGSFYMALGGVSWLERQIAALLLGSLPEGGYDEAERSLGKAVALAPGVIRHHFALGELFMEQGRYREARERFRVVLTLPILLASDERTRSSAATLIQNMDED